MEWGGEFTWKHLFAAARNLTSAVEALHQRGFCVGDLNEANVLISPRALVTLLDCDSFQIRDPGSGRVFRCLVGKPEYTAPELFGSLFRDVDRTPATDAFALAVLLFRLLMEGTHPYQATGDLAAGSDDIAAKIRRGLFPHGSACGDIRPPDHAPPFDILPLRIGELFLRCFEAGHADPAARPSALEWKSALDESFPQFRECRANPHHAFLGRQNECPWCRQRTRTGRDPFPQSAFDPLAAGWAQIPT
jgi:DNA-binding helix-hairpin-helix protein with protein kinase domain